MVANFAAQLLVRTAAQAFNTNIFKILQRLKFDGFIMFSVAITNRFYRHPLIM